MLLAAAQRYHHSCLCVRKLTSLSSRPCSFASCWARCRAFTRHDTLAAPAAGPDVVPLEAAASAAWRRASSRAAASSTLPHLLSRDLKRDQVTGHDGMQVDVRSKLSQEAVSGFLLAVITAQIPQHSTNKDSADSCTAADTAELMYSCWDQEAAAEAAGDQQGLVYIPAAAACSGFM